MWIYRISVVIWISIYHIFNYGFNQILYKFSLIGGEEMKKVVLISAKAQNGKDTAADLMKSYLESKGDKVLICHYADLLKYICKTFFNWDGNKDDKGRTILQHVGTDIIRDENNRPDYWIDFIIDILWMFYDEWDYVLIADARFENEIEKIKSEFNGSLDYNLVQSVRVNRQNNDNKMTDEQRNHISECALDNYKFDHYIENNGTLSELKIKVKDLLDKIDSGVV